MLLSHSLLDEGMFVLQLPLLHGRVDDQLIQLHTTGDEEEHEAAAAVKGAEDKKTQQEVDKLKSQSRHVVKLLDNETKRRHSLMRLAVHNRPQSKHRSRVNVLSSSHLRSQFFHIGVNFIQDVEALLEQCILGSHEGQHLQETWGKQQETVTQLCP